MAGWSLRTKLVVAAAITLLPVLALSGWRAHEAIRETGERRAETVAAAAKLATWRYGQLLQEAQRLLTAACAEGAVQKSADPKPTPADVDRCESYLGALLRKFAKEYSAAIVTDEAGVARCASAPNVVGMSFADREIFRLARDSREVSVGAYISSRVAPSTVIPIAVPIVADGRFRGMCALGIPLRTLADRLAQASDTLTVVPVDRTGAPIGGSPQAASVLPMAGRVAAAIQSGQTALSDYGQNGRLYELHLEPLAGGTLFAVIAMPLTDGLPALLRDWAEVALVVLALAVMLLAVWLGADRWCVRPLRYIQDFSRRVARGEEVTFDPPRPWTPEMIAVGAGVRQMAEAIASREGELRSSLEQRDHMLREIHHRVKNNLQMISSLLNLQAGEIRSPRIRRFFGDAQNRVLTLSILHRHLYERSSWSLVDFQQFISDLVRQISIARPGADRPPPRFHIRAPIMAVGPDTAIPVGLIVTEAVSSALRRGFDGVATPEIRIEAISKGGEQVELVIEDNGGDNGHGTIGANVRGSFGLTLVRGLAMQLGGEVQVSGRAGGGTRVVVGFPMPKEEMDA